MNTTLEALYEYGIVPVVTLNRACDALPVAKALAAGGLPVAEITFRTAAAADSIREITSELPGFIVGAGTVLSTSQARDAIDAGARFAVSPGTNAAVVEYCLGRGIPFIPGCVTPTEIEGALRYGLNTVKYFPAEQLGGINSIRALAAPFAGLRFMPTGGINASKLAEYTSDRLVLAAGGTFICPPEHIESGRFDEITKLARHALFTMYGFTLGHVGINCKNTAEAESGAQMLANLFGLQTSPGDGSIFAGGIFELMRSKYFGEKGHIAILTNTIERAMKYFVRTGLEFEPDGLKYNIDGEINAAYIKGDFSGFALHLLRKQAKT